jgi:NADH:ubiquinone oxidoreductase subunit 6 (subunit J)
MLFKIIVFIVAAIPIVLFVRTMLFRRPTRVSASFQEFKKQANLAVTIFLVLIACVVAAGMGKLAWTWWSSF